ncbi:oligosaccharide flippase family protein [Marinobacter sp. KMM 10035]
MRLIGLFSSMIIARLLTPEEIGTFAIASAVVMIMSEFRILGAGSYLVREDELTREKISSAMGLTMLLSWGLGGSIWVVAGFMSEFYDLPPIENIFKILSVSFFLAPMISIPAALMTREFRFGDIFIIKMVTSIVNLISTIILILLDYGYYALAWGYTLAVLAEFLMVLFFMPKSMIWIPTLGRFKEIAAFGVYASLANLFNRGMVTAPDMIIGKVGTPTQVGMFSRGLGFIEFVSKTLLMGVKPVVLPYLADVKRSGGDTNQAYTQASIMLGGLILPVLAVASIVSLPAILLFFGDQWIAAAPYASIIAIWAMFRTIHWFSSDLLISQGGERVLAIKEGVAFGVLFIAIIVLFPLGLNAVAIGFVLSGLVDFILTTLVLRRFMKLNVIEFLVAWRGTAILTIVCGIVAYGIQQTVLSEGASVFWGLGVVSIFLPVVWIVGLKLTRHPLWVEVRRLF